MYIKKGLFFIILLSTIITTTMLLFKNNDNVSSKVKEDKGYVFDNSLINFKKYNIDISNLKVRVYAEDTKKIQTIPLEDYIVGVVCAEMPAAFEKEALKAQAVAARTYVLAKLINGTRCNKAENIDICNSVHCQAYKDINAFKENWKDSDREMYVNKLKSAVQETKAEVIIFDDAIITNAHYFAVSGGKTESSVAVFGRELPYLKSVESIGDELAPKYKSNIKYTYSEFISKLNTYNSKLGINIFNLKSKVSIVSRNEGGTVNEIKLGDIVIKGTEFRKIMNLNSANFTLNIANNQVSIDVMGYGHGVGMSQWGANGMAKNGSKYNEILEHYYSGTNIKEIK